ncbi:MAG: GAP family protein [Actinobacteria bacterium]|nr:GAP family protein [Actinomycetota bacterium]
MYGEAAGLAALAALSPAALLLVTVYLSSASPGRTVGFCLAGAVLMTVVAGVIVLVALREGGLSVPSHRQPRYGLRLGLGVVALAAGVFLARRKPRPRPARAEKPGLISRMAARPRPLMAFASGLLVFAPSVGFLAAVQVIATSRASDAAEAAALAMVVVIDVALVWLPLVVYLAAPDRTVRALTASSAWISANRHALLAGSLGAIGAILVADGITGLV